MHVIKVHHYTGSRKNIAYIDVDQITMMEVDGRTAPHYGFVTLNKNSLSLKEHSFQRVLNLWKARGVYHARLAMSMLPDGLVYDEEI